MPPCYSFAQKTMNRPRNVLLQLADPREPVTCEFTTTIVTDTDTGDPDRHNHNVNHNKLVIHQTPADASWPGGALWDCGVLIAELLLAVAGVEDMTLRCTLDVEGLPFGRQQPTTNTNTTRTTTQLASRLNKWLRSKPDLKKIWKSKIEQVMLHRSNLTIVELGCGVGLTGLVAATALPLAKTCILTDLTVVVQDVTIKNVQENTTNDGFISRIGRINSSDDDDDGREEERSKGCCRVVGMPFCWGNQEEGEQVLKSLQEQTPPPTTTTTTTATNNGNNNNKPGLRKRYPDIILLGDVAYQHRPNEPLPFDILLQSLQQLMPHDEEGCDIPPTLLIFGLRIRQASSIELLELFQKHFTSVLPQPNASIPADVLDPKVKEINHSMTIHIFTNKGW